MDEKEKMRNPDELNSPPVKKKGKKKKVKDYGSFWYYMNPKNLKSEVSNYGYTITPKRAVFSILGVVALALVMGMVFKLPLIWMGYLILGWVALMPAFIATSYKGMYEQARFADVNTYLEQFLYSFRKTPKIINALNDVLTLFPVGPMHDVIEKAINHIMYGDLKTNVTREALDMIEEAYPCYRMRNVHRFALKSEENGGDASMSVDLLLNDRSLWADRAAAAQIEKKSARTKVVISSFLSLFVCASVLYFRGMNIHIEDNLIFKISTLIVMWIDMIIYIKMSQKINVTMLDDPNDRSEEIALEDYKKLKNFDEEKERKKSYKLCIIPGIAALIGVILLQPIVIVISALVAIFMLNNARINNSLRRKSVIREIEKKFPEWLMEVSLLTQYNNVMVSLELSLETVPLILKEDLEIFLSEAREEPDSIKPYLHFLDMFNLSEIQSAMRMLYSINTGTGGDIQQQTRNLLDRNIMLVDKAEKIKTEEQVAGLNAILYVPTLTGSFKLLCDMTILLMAYMSLM